MATTARRRTQIDGRLTTQREWLTQAAFARRVGVTRQAIHRQVVAGLIPAHGPRRLIDPAEAAEWYAPRLDAGMPQLRMPAPGVAEQWAAQARAELGAWRDWGAETSARLARALGVDVGHVRAVLGPALEERLLWTGLTAAELDVGG